MDIPASALLTPGEQPASARVARDAIVFLPRRAKQVRSCVLALLIGGLLAYVTYVTPAAYGGRWKVGLAAAFLLVFGLVQMAARLRGAPRLTIMPNGISLRGVFRTRRVAWSDLGQFTLTRDAGRRSRLRLIAPILRKARIRGMAESRLTIFDQYEASLEDILAALEAHPAVSALDAQRPRAVLESDVGLAGYRWPWLTTGIAAVLMAVFALEQILAITPPVQPLTPSVSTLVAVGAVSRDMVASGQWWRMLTAPLMHASPTHLLGNIVVMMIAAYRLERFVGRLWMLCLFLVGALAGSAGSIAVNPANMVSVGASGAIMALVAAMFVVCFRLPDGTLKNRMFGYSIRVGLSSLIPFSQTAGTMSIDYGAHAGGALAGLLLGVVMLLSWRQGSRLPGLRAAAAVLSCLSLVAASGSAALAARCYPAYAALGPLIPAASYPRPNQADAMAARLLADYPDDPRASFLAGRARIDAGDFAGGESLVSAAISKLEFQSWRFSPRLINDIRAYLALVLQQQGRSRDALDQAQRLCSLSGAAAPEELMLHQLAAAKLCGPR